MRYFLLIFGLAVITVMLVAGKRGDLSRKPPLEVFPDMDRMPKLRPQTHADFFGDKMSSRLPVDFKSQLHSPFCTDRVPHLLPAKACGQLIR